MNVINRMVMSYWESLLAVFTLPALSIVGFVLSFFSKKTDNSGIPIPEHQLQIIMLVIRIVMPIFFIVTFTLGIKDSPDLFKDFNQVMNKQYEIDTVEVIGHDIVGPDDVSDERSIIVRSLTTGEEYAMSVVYTLIREGETYKVAYLKHSKIGAILGEVK